MTCCFCSRLFLLVLILSTLTISLLCTRPISCIPRLNKLEQPFVIFWYEPLVYFTISVLFCCSPLEFSLVLSDPSFIKMCSLNARHENKSQRLSKVAVNRLLFSMSSNNSESGVIPPITCLCPTAPIAAFRKRDKQEKDDISQERIPQGLSWFG